jgi:hypothetical protein
LCLLFVKALCQLCVVVDHWCWFYEYWFYFWYFIFVILLEKNTAGAEKDKTNKIKNSEFFELWIMKAFGNKGVGNKGIGNKSVDTTNCLTK